MIYYGNGREVRDAIRRADTALIPEARAVFTNSQNVSGRLKHFCGLDSTPLYHPPDDADSFYLRRGGAVFLLSEPHQRVQAPAARHPGAGAGGRATRGWSSAAKARMTHTTTISMRTSPRSGCKTASNSSAGSAKRKNSGSTPNCLAVLYPPVDEDYGYVTLEGMLSSKPVVTCTDSGGPLEFIADGTHRLRHRAGRGGIRSRRWRGCAEDQRRGGVDGQGGAGGLPAAQHHLGSRRGDAAFPRHENRVVFADAARSFGHRQLHRASRGELATARRGALFHGKRGRLLEPATGTAYPSTLGHTSDDLLVSLNAGDLPDLQPRQQSRFFRQDLVSQPGQAGDRHPARREAAPLFRGHLPLRLRDDEALPRRPAASITDALGQQAGQAYWRQRFPSTSWRSISR